MVLVLDLAGEANTGVTLASGDTGGELQDLLRFRRTEGEPGALLVRRSGDLMGVEVLFILLLWLQSSTGLLGTELWREAL